MKEIFKKFESLVAERKALEVEYSNAETEEEELLIEEEFDKIADEVKAIFRIIKADVELYTLFLATYCPEEQYTKEEIELMVADEIQYQKEREQIWNI